MGQIWMPQYWYRSSYALVLGMLWKFQERNVKALLEKRNIFLVCPLICVLLFLFFRKVGFKDATPIFTCAAFACLMYTFPMNKVNSVVSSLSKISYEVYLLQGIPIHFVLSASI